MNDYILDRQNCENSICGTVGPWWAREKYWKAGSIFKTKGKLEMCEKKFRLGMSRKKSRRSKILETGGNFVKFYLAPLKIFVHSKMPPPLKFQGLAPSLPSSTITSVRGGGGHRLKRARATTGFIYISYFWTSL